MSGVRINCTTANVNRNLASSEVINSHISWMPCPCPPFCLHGCNHNSATTLTAGLPSTKYRRMDDDSKPRSSRCRWARILPVLADTISIGRLIGFDNFKIRHNLAAELTASRVTVRSCRCRLCDPFATGLGTCQRRPPRGPSSYNFNWAAQMAFAKTLTSTPAPKPLSRPSVRRATQTIRQTKLPFQ